MKIFLFSGSGFAWRVLLACVVKGIKYEQVFLQPSQTDLKSESFLALNPRGKVPVLEDEGVVIPESMAAIAYLDRKHTDQLLFGTTPAETGEIWRYILDFDLYVSAAMVNKVIAPIAVGQVDSAHAMVQQGADEAHKEITKLEERLKNKPWFVGRTISAADIAIYPILEALIRFTTKDEVAHLDLGFERFDTDFPNLNTWRQAIQQIPNYDKTYPDYWRHVDQAR